MSAWTRWYRSLSRLKHVKVVALDSIDEIFGRLEIKTFKFTEVMLAETGLIAMIGKGERGSEAIEAIRKHRAVYLVAVGGAAYLVSKAIKASRLVAFGDLGMEAIYEFRVEDMPVTVAVDANGQSIHEIGPARWKSQRDRRSPFAIPRRIGCAPNALKN